jgi:hypothetical protein
MEQAEDLELRVETAAVEAPQANRRAKEDAECRAALGKVRLNEQHRLIAEVVLDYSFSAGVATAWIPSIAVFTLRTGIVKREVIRSLQKLETYQMLEIEPAPQPRFPYARRYTFFPPSARTWAIAPRVLNSATAKAFKLHRWLVELNANGGPEQVELFPALWDFSDSLDEWGGVEAGPTVQAPSQAHSPAIPPTLQPAVSNKRGNEVSPPSTSETLPAEETGVDALPPNASEAHPEKQTGGESPPVGGGKSPPVVGNPHRSLHEVHVWNELHEKDQPWTPSQKHEEGGGGGESPPVGAKAEIEDKARPSHWPPREVENRLLREIAEACARFYGVEGGKVMMGKYGGIWRWRIRNYRFAVETAMARAIAQWKEVKKLGGFLTREFRKVQKAINAKQQKALDAEFPPDPRDEQ